MSRQLELKREVKEEARRDALNQALEFGLAGALENQGMKLLGFAIKYEEYDCLMTLKGSANEKRFVCFISADSMITCILTAVARALRTELRWKPDQYWECED